MSFRSKYVCSRKKDKDENNNGGTHQSNAEQAAYHEANAGPGKYVSTDNKGNNSVKTER